jgi:hypothetical protein
MKDIAKMTPKLAYVRPRLKINDTSSGGILKLKFENYPIAQVDRAEINTAQNLESCRLQQLGYNLAWRWFEEVTESGYLPFVIPSAHPVFTGAQRGWGTQAEWARQSLQGLPSLWAIDTFSPPNQNNRYTCNFEMTIVNELRTPVWV